MADDFDFNVAPAQDEVIDMDPWETDNGSGSSGNEAGNAPDFGSIETELMGEDPDSDAESLDSEEAEFRRRVHALISAEAEESGNSDSFGGFSSDEDGSGSDEDGELGFGMPPFANYESESISDSDSDAEPRIRSRDHDHLSLNPWMPYGYDDDDDDDEDDDDDVEGYEIDSQASLMSGATEDSWTERIDYNEVDDSVNVYGSDKALDACRRQHEYREKHRKYERELEDQGKRLEFTKFGQLPPELRLRIWELHCPAMQRSNRVLQMTLGADGFLSPGPTMGHQTRHLRRFMRICHETRALGERYMPDTLSTGVSAHDDGILRYNAQKDIVHFMIETRAGLSDVTSVREEARDMESTKEKEEQQRRIALPHTSVRNVAMLDMEVRSRSPGSYLDRIFGRSVIELVLPDDASHREPQELRPPGFCEAFDYLFPNVENIYVLENGSPRRIDRWIGNQNSYERHHIHTEEDIGSYKPERLEYLYCWHGPPKGFKGRVAAVEVEGGAKSESEAVTEQKESDKDNEDKTISEDNRDTRDTNEEDTDFKDECVINHFAALRKKGVRFSRMLYFETEDGLEDYYRLREMTCPNGEWPKDPDGQPVQDSLPISYDERLDYGDEDDEEDDDEEDDSIVVSDDEEEEDESSSSDGEDGGDDDGEDEDIDDLEILGSESVPLEAIFSSPEPESDEEAEESLKATRGKKRRVVSDSEEEEEEKEEDKEETGPSRRSKKRRVVESDDDDDDDAVVTKSSNKNKPILIADDDDEEEEDEEEEDDDDDDDDDESSHTEEGEEDSEEEEHPKKLSLMQMLQQNRKDNPVSDDDASGSDEDGDAGDYAGDYGEDEDEDEDDE